MYPKWMTILLRYFDCWGFCTEYSPSNSYKNFIRFSFVIHLILGFITNFIHFQQFMKPEIKDILGTINNVLKFSGYQIFYWFSTIEAFIKHGQQRQFWTFFRRIDKHFCSHRKFTLYNYLIKFGTFVLIFFITHLPFTLDMFIIHNFRFWFSYMLLVEVFQNRMFYYLFYLEICSHELKMIERETKQISGIYRSNCNSKFKQFELNRLKWIRDYYLLIYELSSTVNSVFEWSSVVSIIFSFQIISFSINEIYWRWLNQQKIDTLIGKQCWIKN